VLLAEDVEINQIIAEELLTTLGYKVDIAVNGQEVIDMLTQKNYDAVLMDIQMPVMDGLTAARKIREHNEFRNLPIIAVSAHSLPADKEKSLDNGMNDHITKPLDILILEKTLHKWVARIEV
jgi:CheY-like chemotaxis protein